MTFAFIIILPPARILPLFHKLNMKDFQFKLHAPWKDVKEKLKEINTDLTDEDLQYSPGQEEALLKKLSEKLRKDPEQIKALIESVSATDHIAS